MEGRKERWCTIESDPGVFTELLRRIGVTGVQVEELYSLDDVTIASLGKILGLIFLFKWQGAEDDDREVEKEYDAELFFANQVVDNACATQAILAVVLNRPEINIGPELTHLKEFAKEFPPEMKGASIGNTEAIRTAHNSFASPEPFYMEEVAAATKEDDVYHFISFVPVRNKVYELDGLKPGPFCIGECTDENWIEIAIPAVQRKIQRYSEAEIRFNLMAVVPDRLELLENRLEDLKTKRRQLQKEGKLEDISVMEHELSMTREQLRKEEQKRESWKMENTRRRHNYIPFLAHFLRILEEKGKLQPLIEEALQKQREMAEPGTPQEEEE